MQDVTLCFPTLSNYEGLSDAITTAMSGELKPTHIVVMDNGGKFKEFFGEPELDCKLTVLNYGQNMGVAGSWNVFLKSFHDHLIISNDDVKFNKYTIKLLVEAAEHNPNEIFICPDAYWEHFFSLYLIKKKSLDIIGKFDESFFPAYWEDRDYDYRLKLAGYNKFIVKGCTYDHIEGGSKTSRSTVSGNRFQEMMNYYIKKWGSLPGNETYTKPFNI